MSTEVSQATSHVETRKKPMRIEEVDSALIREKALLNAASLLSLVGFSGSKRTLEDTQSILHCKADNIFGPKTYRAILKFQNETGLEPSGIIDADTYEKLLPLLNARESRRKLRIETVFLNCGVPDDWKIAAADFMKNSGLSTMKPSIPILLADAGKKIGICLYGGKVLYTYPIILGKGGTSPGTVQAGVPRTPTNIVFGFDEAKIADTPYGDASLSGNSGGEVRGASLQSGVGREGGGKWWHGVPDTDLAGGATRGCVGMPVDVARHIAGLIQIHGKGYGYVYESFGTSSDSPKLGA